MKTLVAAAVVGLALILLALVPWAHGHSFYDPECCRDRDCAPLADGAVVEDAAGFLIVATGRRIDRDSPKVRLSPDGRWHLCTLGGEPGGTVLCLYVPGRGS